MIKISYRGGCIFAVTLTAQDEANFWAIMRDKLKSTEVTMQDIVKQGLTELTGELPENRS